MEKKLRMTPDQVLSRPSSRCALRATCAPTSSSAPEDGYRSEMDFLCRVLEAVIAEGATTINVPDTVGYAMPELYGKFIKTLRERIPNSDKAIWSVHCHNDLGMAVANSLAGVKIGGARQVECTINGLGERAGNCSLEEIVMAVKTRKDYFGLDVGIDTQHIVPASRMVSQTTGFVVQPNKAVVGANAFAHASGIHQDGVLKARDTYEIMRAEDVGWTANKIVLGKLSGPQRLQAAPAGTGRGAGKRGRHQHRLRPFKELADRKSEIFDEDILALVSDESVTHENEHYGFVSLSQHSETGERPHASGVHRGGQGVPRRIRRQWPGRCVAQGDRVPGEKRRRNGAVFGQRHQRQHREPGRGDGAAAEQRPGGQWRGRRPGHRGGIGQGLSECAEQVAQQS
jgi:2-isopropylmalate synthase